MKQYIPITYDEHVDLIKNCQQVYTTLGPDVCLIYDDAAEELPEAVLRLGLIRGVINENCDGAGI